VLKLIVLGVCLFVCPPLFARLGRRWFPAEYGATASDHLQRARILRRRFWGAFASISSVVASVLLLRWWWLGAFPLGEAKDWLQLAAAVLALLAALGRGGWQIQSWKEETVVERIDRGMYRIEQLGLAALLVLVLTL
jgi:hypothetical protein